MFVQFGEFTADTVNTHGFIGAVGTFNEATVRQATVGVSITHTPVETTVIKVVPACELGVVSGTAGVVILHVVDVVRLCVETCTFRVAVFGYLVEDILELIAMVAVAWLEGEVQQGTEADIIAVLVVRCFPQIDVFVIVGIIRAIERVFHIEISLIGVAVIHSSQHTDGTSAFGFPLAVVCHIQF